MPRITIKQQTYIEVHIDEAKDLTSTEHEPYEVYVRKIEHLAQILDCTEEQAERLLLERL